MKESSACSRRRARLAARSRATVCWIAAFFVLSQLTLVLLMEYRQPMFRDPETGVKYQRLQAARSREPDRPLYLVLGSSRAGLGFRGDLISSWPAPPGEKQPLLFNFALPGHGPILQLLDLKRLLADGIRPDRVFLEVLPLYLHQEGSYGEEKWVNVHTLALRDLPCLSRHCVDPLPVLKAFAWSRLFPIYNNRYGILCRVAPRWLPWDYRTDDIRRTDPYGWKPWPKPSVTPDEAVRASWYAGWQFDGARKNFRITPMPDAALREALTVCKRAGVPATLYVMPEGSEVRRWYSPSMDWEISQYLLCLCRDAGVGLINGRLWISDSGFFDHHHLLAIGATQFSQRFAAEIAGHTETVSPSGQ